MDLPVALRPHAGSTPLPPSAVDAPAAAGLSRPVRLALAALAGLLLYGAFPPLGVWVLAPAGVAVLALACRGATVRSGALVGLLAGAVFFLPLLRWAGLEVGAFPWLLLAALQASFFVPMGAALALVTRLPGWPFWVAAVWVGQEALRARLPFGGFPWGKLAFSQAESPLLRVAALGSSPLVTLAVALLGGALAVLLAERSRRSLLVALALVAAVAVPALLAPVGARGDDTARVAVVQGNVPRLGLGFNDQRAAVLDNHVEATLELADDVRAGRQDAPDLVVWPENSSDIDPFQDPAAYSAIDDAVREIGVPVLVGAVLRRSDGDLSNTGIVWNPGSGPGERYVKRHPVPFGEYIPLRSIASRISDKVDLVPRDFIGGDEVGVLDVGPVRLGDVICFEVVYDDLVRDTVQEGGRLIVVQTNNATFGRSAQTEQQLAMSRLRAVEHGRAVVVSATSGISAVVQPDGSLSHRSQVFTRDVSVTEVTLGDTWTPATRLGALPELVLSLLAAVAVALGARHRRAAA